MALAYAAAPATLPPTVRRLIAGRRAAALVVPSAWKYEYIGLSSNPVKSVDSSLTIQA